MDCRSLKLWFVLRFYGASGLRLYIRSHVALAKHFASLVQSNPNFEVTCLKCWGGGYHKLANKFLSFNANVLLLVHYLLSLLVASIRPMFSTDFEVITGRGMP